ncbi:MAG: aldo/keto reductase [Dehalococcoidia bacterium]|jgi:L-galactose dehydrogenase/L-glyceraldehyde 3-phosphate reductase|nr:aldo/keto reductase [Dehalococcoidia bacterium]
MKYRHYGNTGLEISEIVFGAGAVGGIVIDADDETRRTAIRRALDGGINWIDTAASYGQGRSEEALAWLLKEIPDDEQPYLSTKFNVDAEAGDIPGQIERSMHESLGRLDRDSVDVFQLHTRVSEERGWFQGSIAVDDVLGSDGVADGLQRLVDQGLTRFTGFTATGESSAIHKIIESERFNSAQIYYNVLNPSAGRSVPPEWSTYDFDNIIDACAAHGVAVMNIRVLAAGVIATDVRHGREIPVAPGTEVGQDEASMRKIVEALGDSQGTRAQLAVRYALSNPNVSGVLVGMAELDHLDQALGAQELGPLSSDVLEAVHALVDTDFGRLS